MSQDQSDQPYLQMLPSMEARFYEAGAHCRTSATASGRRSPAGIGGLPRQELQPFLMWILGHPKPGRVIKSEPKVEEREFRHGYDGHGSCDPDGQYTELDGNSTKRSSNTFEDRSRFDVRDEYGSTRSAADVETLLLDEGRPIAFLRYSQGGQDRRRL